MEEMVLEVTIDMEEVAEVALVDSGGQLEIITLEEEYLEIKEGWNIELITYAGRLDASKQIVEANQNLDCRSEA